MFEAFQFGPFIVWTRLLFLLFGIWFSIHFFLKLAQSQHLHLKHFLEKGWYYVLAFLLSGRIFAIIAQYRLYTKEPLRGFIIWDGGFSYLGGMIGIAAVLYWLNRKQRSTFLQWLDVLLPATTLGMVFDWIGRFVAGSSYGRPTDAFFGVTYDAMNVRYAVPIHPVQLYYVITFLIITFVLLIIRKYKLRAGAETLWGITITSLAIVVLETFRGDFMIPVFASSFDMIVLALLFVSLGVFAYFETQLSKRVIATAQTLLLVIFGSYILMRSSLPFDTFELRFSQFLSLLGLLSTIVYVVVHRQKHPNL